MITNNCMVIKLMIREQKHKDRTCVSNKMTQGFWSIRGRMGLSALCTKLQRNSKTNL